MPRWRESTNVVHSVAETICRGNGRSEVDQDPYRVHFADHGPEVGVHGDPRTLCHASPKTTPNSCELWLNCDAWNDSRRPAFSGTAGRTHESNMEGLASRLSALACAFALCAMVLPHIAAAATASDTVRSFYQTLQYNMQNGPSIGQQGRVAGSRRLCRLFSIFHI